MLNLRLDVEQKLTHIPEVKYHNLVIAKLVSVKKESTTVALQDENGNPSNSEYRGKTISRIVFHTERHILPISVDKNPREDKFSFGLSASVDYKSGQPKTDKELASSYEDTFMMLIHIHNVYRKHHNVAPLDLAILSKFDPKAPIDDRIAAFEVILDYLVAEYNKVIEATGKVLFEDVVCAWVMIPGGNNRSKYTIPRYVGKGVLEIFRNAEHVPALEIPSSVIMEKGVKAKTPNTPGGAQASAQTYASHLNFDEQ